MSKPILTQPEYNELKQLFKAGRLFSEMLTSSEIDSLKHYQEWGIVANIIEHGEDVWVLTPAFENEAAKGFRP